MTDAEWKNHMAKAIGPHLEAMSAEVREAWGDHVDPEVLLLRWLCSKKGLEPPHAANVRKPNSSSASGSSTQAPRSKPSTSGLAPPNSARDKLPPPSSPSKSTTASPQKSQADSLQMSQVETSYTSMPHSQPTSPLSARLPPRSQPTSPHSARLPQLSQPTSPEIGKAAKELQLGSPQKPVWRSRLGSHNPDVKPWERTLKNVISQLPTDQRRHTQMTEHLKANDGRLRDMMAYMNQDIRGQFLAKVPLLSSAVLDEKVQFSLVSRLSTIFIDKGQHIITEDHVGDKLYIIERGVCDVIKKLNGRDVVVGQLGKGAFFGEIAVLYDMPRTATVRAQTEVIALSLSRSDLKETLSDEDMDRMRLMARTQVFSSMPLLAGLNPDQKAAVAHKLKSQRWSKGAVLAGQSHITSRVYIIEQGSVMMEVSDTSSLPSFMAAATTGQGNRLGPGQYFGMRGLLYGAPYGFTITAVSEEVQTLSISYEELLETAGEEVEARNHLNTHLKESMQAFLVRQIPELKPLADASFKEVQSHVQEVVFNKWAVIVEKGSPIEYVYVLEKGKLAQYDGEASKLLESYDKEVHCPECVTPGLFFGNECLSKKGARSPYTLVALTDVNLLQVPPREVWAVQQEARLFLSRIPLFSSDLLTEDEQFLLVAKLKPWNFPSGRYIINEGEIGDMLYIIERGVCDACKVIDGQEVRLGQLKKGAFFGEMAVVFDMPRSASVRATVNVTALSLSREDLTSAIGPEKIKEMRLLARTQVFTSMPLLANLAARAKIQLARTLTRHTYKGGSVVVNSDDVTERIYIVEKGQLAVISEDGARESNMVAGMSFGMGKFLYSERYGIKVVTEGEEAELLSITLEDIFSTCGKGERDALQRQLQTDYRAWLLKGIPALRKKPDEELQRLLNHCEVMSFSRDAIVFHKGEAVSSVYIVESGSFTSGEDGVDMVKSGSTMVGAVVCPWLKIFGLEWVDSKDVQMFAPYSLRATSKSTLLRVPFSKLRS
eukprot:TRINITY_DN22761_c0_g1_i1.p1 TRINITY_DN22761_c0_g1~~TRINITY_DN22761_c0_g1_i1.p1  ORF type:complete len:999 (+),score=209.65 TRINITY_DN22761_c0_g1_i1:102-3098(+)